jgi:hypothetical protein
MIGQGDQPILATLQFISEEYSLRASEGDGGINDKPVQYNAVSGIKVHDLRSAKLTYLENGISIINIDSKMSLEDFSKKEVIENVYLAEVENHLIKEFDAKSIFIFDWVLRDSSLRIPEQSPTPRKNPAIWAHLGGYTALQSAKREGSIKLTRLKIIHPPRLQTGSAPCSARKHRLCWQDDMRWLSTPTSWSRNIFVGSLLT